jgi:hypothetical protein
LIHVYSNSLGNIRGTFRNLKNYIKEPGKVKLHPITAGEGASQMNLIPGAALMIINANGNDAVIAHRDRSPFPLTVLYGLAFSFK